jgi:MFS family permease
MMTESLCTEGESCMKTPAHPPVRISWLVWGLGALLYFTGFYQRVAPAVMTDQLMSDFRIGATALGNFSAFYFYSYVAMQVPTGILADHLGSRKLLAAGALIAGIGALCFSLAQHLILANMGRLLIGGSVAVAWVALMKLAIHWFPPQRFAQVTGVGLLCGVAGAVSAGIPLRLLVEWMGWRSVMLAMSLFSVGIAIAIWLVVRDDPSEKGYASFAPTTSGERGAGQILSGLAEVLRYRNTMLLAIAQGAQVGAVLAFCGLWGVPYLAVRYGLTPSESAAVTSTIMLAWALAGPLIGTISDKVCRRKNIYLAATILAAMGWCAAIYVSSLPLYAFVILATLAGMACGAIIIGFAFAKESVPAELAGTVSGVCNMGAMSGPMLLQPAMGLVLDLYWNGTLVNGARVYDLEAYRSGFLLMLAWLALAVAAAALTRDSCCRQVVAEAAAGLPSPSSAQVAQ